MVFQKNFGFEDGYLNSRFFFGQREGGEGEDKGFPNHISNPNLKKILGNKNIQMYLLLLCL